MTNKDVVDFLKEPSERLQVDEIVASVREGAQRVYGRARQGNPIVAAVMALTVGVAIGYLCRRLTE